MTFSHGGLFSETVFTVFLGIPTTTVVRYNMENIPSTDDTALIDGNKKELEVVIDSIEKG